ncbi:hypothetical protein M2G46_22195 [Vibrio vulnificus]|nr:hypothetical protein [Vibrio vulnificus]
MKKNIKIKTNSFRLSLTLKFNFKFLINKDFLARDKGNDGECAKVKHLDNEMAFTLAHSPPQVN